MNIKKIKAFVYLHILLIMYSLGAVCSKLAGESEMLSFRFCFFYFLVLLNLFVYAIVWQQILKRIPLVVAYANKAITVIWGILWGMLIFKETITMWNIIGAGVIILGIFLVVSDNED